MITSKKGKVEGIKLDESCRKYIKYTFHHSGSKKFLLIQTIPNKMNLKEWCSEAKLKIERFKLLDNSKHMLKLEDDFIDSDGLFI